MNDDDWLHALNLHCVNLKKNLGILNCPRIAATSDVARAFHDISLLHDQIWVAGALDAKFRMVSWSIIGIGATPNIRPIDVFAGSIIQSVKYSFLVRNEPSKSKKSIDTSERALLHSLCEASELLGHSFLDFVVIGRDFCRSVLYESNFPRHIDAPVDQSLQRNLKSSNTPTHRYSCV